MKKFFKKIAFVSAMAMVVSAMPAQSAAAAEGPQMYSSLKFYLGGDKSGSYSDDAKYAKVWNKDGYTVEFESDNEDVATVGTRGLVTPVSVGTANVTATFTDEDGDTVSKVCKVTVKNNAVEAGISDASATALKNLKVGDEFQTKTYRTDANGVTSWKGKDVITDSARFTSSDAKVFTVSKTGGKVKAVGAGEATLSVWAVQSEGATYGADGKVTEYLATTPVKTYPVVVTEHKRAQLSASSYEIKADGAASAIITFKLYQADGSLDQETKDVQVTFSTTRGTMAFNNVTLEDGVANVLFTSPILTTTETALIQAIVTGAGADDQDLINIEADPIEIKLNPVVGVDAGESKTGAKLISATAVTADRVTLYFNKTVTPADFMKDGAPNPAAFVFELDDQIAPTATTVAAADITTADIAYIVQNTSTSLTFVFKDNVNGGDKILTDNTKFAVYFKDTRWAAVEGETYNYVTDAVNPKVLSVKVVNLKQIDVTFSEAIAYETAAAQFAIDGYALSSGIAAASDKWGVASGSGAEATVARVEDSDALKVARNVWRVTLGKDATGKQVYFKAGTHSVTIYNIKDQAGLTDAANVVASQTLDFYVPANDVLPSYSVVAQSPEQYLVTFNCLLEADASAVLKLVYFDEIDNGWKDVAVGGSEQIINLYNIVDVTGNGPVSKYLIEVKSDWTVVMNASTANRPNNLGPVKNTNYYNYRFAIAADANTLANAANGKTNNAAINMEMTDSIMKTVDATVPALVGNVTEKTQGKVYTINFSEPVQISNTSVYTDNATNGALNYGPGNITASTQQVIGVPETTVYIVSEDLTQTYAATITAVSRDNMYAEVTVNSPNTLDAGKNYVLYVRNASDDIGNSANTIVKAFTTPGATVTTTDFKITYVKADASLDFGTGVTALTPYAPADTASDALYVAFTKDFAKSGGLKTVLTNTNWTINGMALPAGTVIITGVIGDSTVNGVTIILPNGTITDINQTVVTLSKTVTDVDGNELKGENRVVTQYIAP